MKHLILIIVSILSCCAPQKAESILVNQVSQTRLINSSSLSLSQAPHLSGESLKSRHKNKINLAAHHRAWKRDAGQWHIVDDTNISNGGGALLPRNLSLTQPVSRKNYPEFIKYNVCCIAGASSLAPAHNGYVKIKHIGTLANAYSLRSDVKFANEPVIGHHRYASNKKFLSPATGFLISKNYLVTAYHVIAEMSEAQRRSELRFIFGYRKKTLLDRKAYQVPAAFIRRYKRIVKKSANYISASSRDWCIIELEDSPYPYTGLRLSKNLPKLGEDLIMVGHPVGLSMKDHENAKILKIERSRNTGPVYYSTLDGFRGNSGSPVFSKSGLQVIGLFVASHPRDFYDRGHMRTRAGVAPQKLISIRPIFNYLKQNN